MSTPNFCKHEASNYYAICISEETQNDNIYVDELKDYIAFEVESMAKKYGYYTDEKEFYETRINRSYGGSYIISIGKHETIADFTISIECNIIISNGYYSGAIFDYITEVQFEGYEYGDKKYFDENFDYKDLNIVSEHSTEKLEGYAKTVKRFVSSAIPELHERIEKIFETYCERKLIKTAQFSNGEAWYNEAN